MVVTLLPIYQRLAFLMTIFGMFYLVLNRVFLVFIWRYYIDFF